MRNIREVKVGDFVRDNLGVEYRVQEVLPNSFAIAGRPTMLRRLEWVEKGFAEEQGWEMPLNVPKEVGVDDSEEAREHNRLLELSAKRIEEGTKIMREALNKVTLTEDEIISLLNVTEEQLRDPHFMASRITQEQWKTLKSKLNKMLKEKE